MVREAGGGAGGGDIRAERLEAAVVGGGGEIKREGESEEREGEERDHGN